MNIITIEPIIKFASADDPLFTEYKTIIGNDHLTPGEALQWLLANVVIMVEPLSALYYLSEPIKKSNRSQQDYGSRECALRTVLNGLKFRVQIRAPISNWLERHTAYVAGLELFQSMMGLLLRKESPLG